MAWFRCASLRSMTATMPPDPAPLHARQQRFPAYPRLRALIQGRHGPCDGLEQRAHGTGPGNLRARQNFLHLWENVPVERVASTCLLLAALRLLVTADYI